MPDKKILDYIRNEASLGVNKQAIINSLLLEGWQESQINEAFASLSAPVTTPQVQTSTAPTVKVLEENTVSKETITKFPTSKRKKILIGIGIFTIILFLLVSTTTILFAYDKLPIKNYDLENKIADILMQIPFMPKTPRFVLESSAKAHLTVQKVAFDASVAADADSLSSIVGGGGKIDAELTGAVDYTDKENILADLNAKITKDFEFDFLTKDQSYYFRVDSIPAVISALLISFGIPQSVQDEFIKHWFYVDSKPLSTDARASLDSSQKDKQTIQQGVKDYLDAFNNPDVLKNLSMTNEKLDKADTYHLHFAPDDKVLNIFWSKYTKQEANKKTNAYSADYKISDSVKDFIIDIWIDRSTYFIQKSTATFTIKSSDGVNSLNVASPLGMLGAQKKEIPVSISVKLSHFNEAVIIDVPRDAVKFDDFIKKAATEMAAQRSKVPTTTPTPIPTPTPKPKLSN